MKAIPPAMLTTRRQLIASAAALMVSGVTRAATPQRIVSLNPCLDTILVHVADRSQIAALSHYSRQAGSTTIADIAATLPYTYESAEEVAALSPDLVLASRHTALATRQALTRLNIPFALFAVPERVEDSVQQITDIAALCGRPEVGAALVGSIQDALAAAVPPPDWKPIEAIVFQARGLAAGEGTLVDEMLNRTGFVNVAARYGVKKWGNIQLENLIADPPQLLLSGEASPGAPIWAERILSHPALRAVAHRMQRAPFSEALLYCGGPVLCQTASALRAARAHFEQDRS